MTDGCKWKDGDYIPCAGMQSAFRSTVFGRYYGGAYVIPFKGSRNEKSIPFCPFCGADIRKPVEIKVGMFGKFSNINGFYIHGVLAKINKQTGFYVCQGDYSKWHKFIPGLPEEFNQDGTPKKESAFKCYNPRKNFHPLTKSPNRV